MITTELKKIIFILILFLPAKVLCQQFPFMEGYSVNPFSLSPAFAGIHNSKTLFMDYRSDWTGLEGGPRTYQLTYSDKFRKHVGLGVRFIYDKTDIFKHTLILGTYTYEVKIAKEHIVNLGFSAGFYRNSIDLGKYYNDPGYVQDMVLVYSMEKSKVLLATDFGVLYRFRQLETGIYFSNVMFGTAKYRNTKLTYKPLKNYLLHASYLYEINDKWSAKPTIVFRGGQNMPFQFEVSPTITWNSKFWGTVLYRTGGILGVGFGGELYDMIILNYSKNLNTNAFINQLGSNQISLGIKIFNLVKNKKNQGV